MATALKTLPPLPDAVTYTYNSTVTRVIDGDTLQVEVDLGFNTWRHERFRLAHINCPETSTPEGKAVKAFVTEWASKQTAFVAMSKGQDKYGRWVAVIWGDDRTRSLNQLLLDQGMAVSFM